MNAVITMFLRILQIFKMVYHRVPLVLSGERLEYQHLAERMILCGLVSTPSVPKYKAPLLDYDLYTYNMSTKFV
jgi:hypothetical protein